MRNKDGKYFMSPIVIDESQWVKKEATVPFRKKLVRQVSETNFVLYQDILNNIVNWIVVFLYIYYLENLKAFQEYGWFQFYHVTVHTYFFVDFFIRMLCSKYPKRSLNEFCSWIELLTIVPFFFIYFVIS